MIDYKISEFLDKHPELTFDGIDYRQKGQDYDNNKQALLNAVDEIEMCIEWLNKFYVTNFKLVNPISNSNLKHYVEKYFKTYISPGSVIAAVKILNVRHWQYEDDPNIYLSFRKDRMRNLEEIYRLESELHQRSNNVVESI